MNLFVLLLALMPTLAAEEHPPAPPIHEQTITVSAEILAGLPRVKVDAKEHDNPTATYEGVPSVRSSNAPDCRAAKSCAEKRYAPSSSSPPRTATK